MSGFESRFRRLWAVGSIVTSTGPLALWLTTGLVPPWPRASGVVATLFCALGVTCVYSIGGSRPRRASGSTLLTAIGCLLILLGLAGVLAYLALDNLYVVEAEQTVADGEVQYLRFVIGDTPLPGVGIDTPKKMLADGGYDPFATWTRSSVIRARFFVASSFFLSFLTLSCGMAFLALRPSSDGG